MSLIFPNGSRTANTQPKPPAANTNAPGYAAGAQQKSAIDMSSYAPGRAQPRPPQSQGTPFQAYSPQQTASYSANQDGVSRTLPGLGSAGNYGNAPAGSRPPAFTESAVGVNGQQFSAPSQAFAQRDALIDRINAAKAPMFAGAGTYLGEGAPPPTWGQKPPLDFNTLMRQANDMVAGGWQNPFAQQPAGLTMAPPMGDITPEAMRAGIGDRPFGIPFDQRQPGVGGVRMTSGDPQSVQRYLDAQRQFQSPYRAPMGDALPPPVQELSVVRHWTDNPAYQQPQFQEPAVPQVAGTTDFFTGRSVPPVSGPAMQPPEGASQLGTYVSPRFRMPSIPGRKMPSQGRRVQA